MAIATFTIEAGAESLTPDEVVAKVNAATVDITRASSVSAAARPIEAGEISTTELDAASVTVAKLASTAAKDNLDALTPTARGYIKTEPTSGEFPIVGIQRDSGGQLDVNYDDIAII